MLLLGGALAGLVLGYVLQRGQLCFHAAFRGVLERRAATFKAWLLGAAVAAVGLALLDAVGPWAMSTSLSLRPVRNLVGGVAFGVGMAVAASCVSGLFYKLGAGMLGALVGLVAWGLGELGVRYVQLAAGGALMGAGARLAGGCSLGHTLSGVAQLNLLSLLVVAAMVGGIAMTRAVQVRLGTRSVRHDPAYRGIAADVDGDASR